MISHFFVIILLSLCFNSISSMHLPRKVLGPIYINGNESISILQMYIETSTGNKNAKTSVLSIEEIDSVLARLGLESEKLDQFPECKSAKNHAIKKKIFIMRLNTGLIGKIWKIIKASKGV